MDTQRASLGQAHHFAAKWCGRVIRWGGVVAGIASSLWSVGAVRYAPIVAMPEWAAMIAAGVYVVGIGVGVWVVWRRGWWARVGVLAAPAIVVLAAWATVRPSNDREWSPDQAVLPWAEVEGDVVTVRNIRSCIYRSTTDFDVRHRDDVFDLRTLDRAWLMVEPLPRVPGGAHVFVTYGFEDGRTLAVSVEVRREAGESFGPLRGMFRRFEMMYVVADETDVIRLRTDHRGHSVYLYPIVTSPTRARAMLLHMLDRCNQLRERPEFYHTVLNNCTTAVVRHANRVSAVHVPWTLPVLFPRNADELAHRLGLIPNDVPIGDLRVRSDIAERARAWPEGVGFSGWIRGED